MPGRYVECKGENRKARNQSGEPVTQPCSVCGQQVGTKKIRKDGKTVHVFERHERVVDA